MRGNISETLSAGSAGPTIGTSGMLSPEMFGSTSNLTLRMLLRRSDPAGVACQAPGGAGVGAIDDGWP